jgi:Xaa-Pro aminopeptidase
MQQRLRKIRKEIHGRGLDGLVVNNLLNIRYLCGFSGSSALLLVTLENAYLFTDFRYDEQAHAQVKGCQVVIGKRNPFEELGSHHAMAELHAIGFETKHLTHFQYKQLRGVHPRAYRIPTLDLTEKLRVCKDAREISTLKRAAKVVDVTFQAILDLLRSGVEERQVAADIDYLLRQNGASRPSFDTIVAGGERSSLPHAQPGSRRLRKGDFVVIDMGAVVDGYCSDMTRTVVLGEATRRQREIYDLVLCAQRTAVDRVQSGLFCSELDAVARDVIDKGGYGKRFGHGLGHGVGLNVHEAPSVSSKSTDRLEPGMIVTVEPGVYLPNVGGVRIEDMVLVTQDGPEVLTHSPKELIEL